MKNNIIKELQYFKGIKFHEEQHFYTLNDYKFGISATSLIETYGQEFDSDSVSQMVANKRGISQQEVLNEWKKENEFSCIKGSCIHLKAQSLWMGTNYEIDYNTINNNIDKNRLKKEYDIMSKQAINFYNDYKDMYDMIQDEFIVWSKEFDIAGSIDGIMYNKYTQQCCILDFKSNKDLQFESKYHKKMKVPLHKLDDVNGQHYYIQLSIYKYLIEKYTNIKVDETFIVYFNINADNYEIIEIPYLEKEVKEILEIRRERKMGKCIPVLIIGKSGSGKSTSLRNLKKEEYSLVNPLAKRLPFKGGQAGLESCDYELIKKFIQETPKDIIVIDDSNYLLTMEMMKKAKETGYGKFTDIALNYWKLIEFIKNLDGDKRVYLMSHEEIDEFGNIGVKTVGKMLSNQCCVEGLYTIVLRATNENGKFQFRTKTAGNDIVKTPIGLFEEELIDNDLKLVDDTICEYYEINKEEKKDEEEK